MDRGSQLLNVREKNNIRVSSMLLASSRIIIATIYATTRAAAFLLEHCRANDNDFVYTIIYCTP